jgi:hypothetical protein
MTPPPTKKRSLGWTIAVVVVVVIVVLAVMFVAMVILVETAEFWEGTRVTVNVNVVDDSDGSAMADYQVTVKVEDEFTSNLIEHKGNTNQNGLCIIKFTISEPGDYWITAWAYSSFWGLPVESETEYLEVYDGLGWEEFNLDLVV